MDKNTLVGLLLIILVLFGFIFLTRPSQEEIVQAQHYQDSIQAIIDQEEKEFIEKESSTKQTITIDSTSQFFAHTQGTEEFTVLENNVVQLTFSNKGGRVSKAMLKEYNNQQKQPLVLFDGEDASLNLGFEGKTENILSSDLSTAP